MTLLRQHREELIADFVRYYHATPFALWRAGMHLLDVASLATHLPYDSAVARIHPLHEWVPLSTGAAVQAVNEIRLLREQISSFLGGKYKAELIRPEGTSGVESPDAEVDRIGANDGFDTEDEARGWYLARFPEMAGRI